MGIVGKSEQRSVLQPGRDMPREQVHLRGVRIAGEDDIGGAKDAEGGERNVRGSRLDLHQPGYRRQSLACHFALP
jgi:hypothetical protein